jgi:4-alpha-glucanotransferase
LPADIFGHKFQQFEFHRQWQALKQYANERQIQIIGDIPIYVAHDSVDVWAYTDNFMIDPETLAPSQMAGVPPDYFSETGQLWGNPTYNWAVLKERNFNWWLQRLKAILDYVDLIRVDHFRGTLQAFWAVPPGKTTAMNGEWVEAPGYELFETVKRELGSLAHSGGRPGGDYPRCRKAAGYLRVPRHENSAFRLRVGQQQPLPAVLLHP